MTTNDIQPGHVLYRDSVITRIDVVENKYANNLQLHFENDEINCLVIRFFLYTLFVYQEHEL